MKNQLNQNLIERLAESSNQEFSESVNQTVYNLVSSAIEELAEKSPFVTPDKCILIPVNEVCTGAVTQLSTYDYFLGIENMQIELNTKNSKNFWKHAWREFRASWRLGRKKYKNKKKEQISTQSLQKYQLGDFRHDVVFHLSQFLSETSIIYEYGRYITIVGQQDFGTNVQINIFISCFDSDSNTFKLYSENKNKYSVISFGSRYENLHYKTEQCGEMFVNMLKILNAIYSKTYNKVPNQILMESLLFNCPNNLFDKNDIFKTFVNIANFIRLYSPTSFLSICDTSKNIFDEKNIVGSGRQIEFGKVLNMLDSFKY